MSYRFPLLWAAPERVTPSSTLQSQDTLNTPKNIGPIGAGSEKARPRPLFSRRARQEPTDVYSPSPLRQGIKLFLKWLAVFTAIIGLGGTWVKEQFTEKDYDINPFPDRDPEKTEIIPAENMEIPLSFGFQYTLHGQPLPQDYLDGIAGIAQQLAIPADALALAIRANSGFLYGEDSRNSFGQIGIGQWPSDELSPEKIGDKHAQLARLYQDLSQVKHEVGGFYDAKEVYFATLAGTHGVNTLRQNNPSATLAAQGSNEYDKKLKPFDDESKGYVTVDEVAFYFDSMVARTPRNPDFSPPPEFMNPMRPFGQWMLNHFPQSTAQSASPPPGNSAAEILTNPPPSTEWDTPSIGTGLESINLWSSKNGQVLSDAFHHRVVQLANKYGADPDWFMGVFAHESAGTFSPTIHNGSGYYGILQINAANLRETVGWDLQTYLNQTNVGQVDAVEAYFDHWIDYTERQLGQQITLDSPGEVYVVVTAPVKLLEYKRAVLNGQDPSTIEIYQPGSAAYNHPTNQGWKDANGRMTMVMQGKIVEEKIATYSRSRQ